MQDKFRAVHKYKQRAVFFLYLLRGLNFSILNPLIPHRCLPLLSVTSHLFFFPWGKNKLFLPGGFPSESLAQSPVSALKAESLSDWCLSAPLLMTGLLISNFRLTEAFGVNSTVANINNRASCVPSQGETSLHSASIKYQVPGSLLSPQRLREGNSPKRHMAVK